MDKGEEYAGSSLACPGHIERQKQGERTGSLTIGTVVVIITLPGKFFQSMMDLSK